MVQILTVKYTKEEERILAVSGFIGMLFGIPAGILLCYCVGFFANVDLVANDIIGWTMFLYKIGLIIILLIWTTSFVLQVLFFKRRNWTLSKQNIKRMLLGTLLVPLIFTYTFLVFGLIFVPLNAFLIQYLSPFMIVMIGALVFFPFMIAFAAIILPDTPAGKVLRRFLHLSKKEGSKSKERES
jgi:hypothetical protein